MHAEVEGHKKFCSKEDKWHFYSIKKVFLLPLSPFPTSPPLNLAFLVSFFSLSLSVFYHLNLSATLSFCPSSPSLPASCLPCCPLLLPPSLHYFVCYTLLLPLFPSFICLSVFSPTVLLPFPSFCISISVLLPLSICLLSISTSLLLPLSHSILLFVILPLFFSPSPFLCLATSISSCFFSFY